MSVQTANLKRLARTCIPMNFVKKQKGVWNHEEWLLFCDMLKEKGYTPIDLDQVGLLLEEKKTAYLEEKSYC